MERDRLIELLARSEGYVSGEKLSGALSVTRAAVWKEISALRQAGWPIVSAPGWATAWKERLPFCLERISLESCPRTACFPVKY